MKKLIGLGILLLVVLFVITGCNNVSTAPFVQAVHTQGGAIQDHSIQGCIPPGTNDRAGWFSEEFDYYFTNQRDYSATRADTAEAPPFEVVSSDNAEMEVPMTVTLTLTTDCDKLIDFHRNLGSRYNADVGENGEELEGWVDMLDFVIGVPADTLLDRVAQQQKWRDLWNDPATKAEVERAMEEQLPAMIRQQAGGDYFRVQNVLVLKPTPTDKRLVKNINLEQSAVARANAQEAQARADEARANAQVAVAKAEAARKRANIAGFMLPGMSPEEAVRAFNEAQLIQRGENPWQPTVAIPGLSR